ncbi:MAG: LamG-like jellyroll fold domain-containing protein [Opitutaceae bacterium]
METTPIAPFLLLVLSAFFVFSPRAEALDPDPYPEFLFHDGFDGDGLAVNAIKGGGLISAGPTTANWSDHGEALYDNNGTGSDQRAILYSANSFQSDSGFRLHVNYETGSIGTDGSHNLSFGLVSSDTDLANYSGFNPFQAESGVYSIGANLTTQGGATFRGLNFADGTSVVSLDSSGSRQQFVAGESTEVTIEISYAGYWCYRINGEYEASGALPVDFDLTKNFHIVVYGQDDGAGKSIQSITLEKGYAQGERAASLRGSWNCGQGDADFLQNMKTVKSTLARLNEGSVVSAEHNAPHRLLEMIAEGLSSVGGSAITAPVPATWGDFNDDEPDSDRFLNEISGIRNAQLGAKFYSNSDNFTGSNASAYEPFAERWFEYCDTNPEVQAFIASQPYHTGIWNRVNEQYEDASAQYPNRKYVFCYAEFVLKDYALRYGKYASSWTFDSAKHMVANGDMDDSGLVEEQRLYQAFANAVWAGSPDCPVAFNNGRLSNDEFGENDEFPYARSTRFDDYTFGHAHNGNSDHASLAVNPIRNETVFSSNYRHITRMTLTNGYVKAGGEWDWDDLVVGNYHSKLGPQSWRFSTPSAWSQDDFNQWNLEAIQAGGHMTWEGSIPRSGPPLRDWAQDLIAATDAYLAENAFPETPGWARKYTDLPDARTGQPYYHVLVEGIDFWDPEGDEIASISAVKDGFFSKVPTWLTITEDPEQAGDWILSGVPTESSASAYEFVLEATDVNDHSGSRSVELQVMDVPERLIAEWKFDEGQGTVVADSVSGAYEATRATGAWVDGAYGSAMEFDGSQAGLLLPAGAFTEVSESDAITISMWVNGDSSQPVADTIFNARDSSDDRVLNIHLPWKTEEVIWDGGDASGYDRVRKDTVSSEYEGSWHHWIFTKDATTGEMAIYFNGVLWLSGMGHTRAIGEIENVVLGNDVDGEGGYYGAIDEVRIYARALSSDEVASLHTSYTVTDAFNLWFDSFTGTSTPGALNTDWAEDFDSDGISNLMEFILTGDPTVADTSIFPEVVMDDPSDDLVFRFERRTDSADDTVQTFCYSSDLEIWDRIELSDDSMSSAVEIFDLDAETQQVDIKFDFEDLADPGKVFGRLEAYFKE